MDYGFQRYGTELDSKQRRVADEYVRLCGYKHGEIGGDHNQRCQNGTSEKLTLDKRSDIHMGEQKEKKIIFSEEIDSSITGIALGASFVALAILVWKFEMFHNHTVNSVVQIVLLIIGILGTAVEFDKINKNDIKGIDDLFYGIVFSGISILVIWKFDKLIGNIICFFIALFGTYELFVGVLKIIYSLKIRKRTSDNKKIQIMNIVVMVTEILALICAILDMVSKSGIINP